MSALRRAGVPMQRIRPAVARLESEIGLEHALASKRVYTDGAELVFDYAEESDDEAMLAVVRTGQRQFEQIIRGYLERITYGSDGWAAQLRLPAYSTAEVVVDPSQAFGQPLVVHGGARVEDLVDRFQAGDGLDEIADDFGRASERGGGRDSCRPPRRRLSSSSTAASAATNSLPRFALSAPTRGPWLRSTARRSPRPRGCDMACRCLAAMAGS